MMLKGVSGNMTEFTVSMDFIVDLGFLNPHHEFENI